MKREKKCKYFSCDLRSVFLSQYNPPSYIPRPGDKMVKRRWEAIKVSLYIEINFIKSPRIPACAVRQKIREGAVLKVRVIWCPWHSAFTFPEFIGCIPNFGGRKMDSPNFPWNLNFNESLQFIFRLGRLHSFQFSFIEKLAETMENSRTGELIQDHIFTP